MGTIPREVGAALMSEFEVIVTERGATPKLMRRALNEIGRKAAFDTVDYWHRIIEPATFTHAGASARGFVNRNKNYERYKLRRFGHTYPGVFTGKTRDDALSKVRIQATAKKGEARGVAFIDAYGLNRKNPKSKIDLRKEIISISREEYESLAAVAHDKVADQLARLSDNDSTKL